MPEGDTIHNLAARLRPVLAGAALVRFEAPRLHGALRPRPGMAIESVDARGKHLLIGFERDLVLEIHLGMVGTWQLARPGDRWRRPAHLLRVRVGVEEGDALFFSVPTVRVFVNREGRPSPLAHLGPDLATAVVGSAADDAAALDTASAIDPAIDVALDRMARIVDPGCSVAEVLLDQRVAAGVGNVFKSEVLWACRVDPFAPIGTVDDATRRALLTTAAAQLQANLGPGSRRTVSSRGGSSRVVPGGLAVYGRARQPCLRCQTPIQMRRHGAQARRTYWCPRCQVLPQAAPAP